MAMSSLTRSDAMAIKLKVALVLVLLALAVQPALATQNSERDVSAIRQVVEAFRSAIVEKDKARFTALFFSEDPARVTWQFVNDDARLARFRAVKPDARKARYIPQSNYLSFIDSIVTSAQASEEVFSDVRIDTDGEIAAVAFDYAYLENGRQTNRGREMWQLIRTEAGWKIISVVWTMRDPARAS